MKTGVKRRLAVLMCIGCLVLPAAGCRTKPSFETAEIGILYSTESGSRSSVEWFDGALRPLGTVSYPFSGASVSQSNAHLQDGTVFLAPSGDAQTKDYGKIAILNPAEGSFREIDTGRVNQYDCDVEDAHLVLTSNLNGDCYVDDIHLETGKIRTVRPSENHWMCTQPVFVNGAVYACATDGESYFICACDFDSGKTEIVARLPDERTTYLERHGADLVYLSQGRLVKYHTATGKTESTELSRTDALNLNIAGDVVWIAYTDPFDESGESLIEARDYGSGEVLCRGSVDGAVLQLETDNRRLFLRNGDTLIAYDVDGDKLTETDRLLCEKNGCYFGGFFYLEGM